MPQPHLGASLARGALHGGVWGLPQAPSPPSGAHPGASWDLERGSRFTIHAAPGRSQGPSRMWSFSSQGTRAPDPSPSPPLRQSSSPASCPLRRRPTTRGPRSASRPMPQCFGIETAGAPGRRQPLPGKPLPGLPSAATPRRLPHGRRICPGLPPERAPTRSLRVPPFGARGPVSRTPRCWSPVTRIPFSVGVLHTDASMPPRDVSDPLRAPVDSCSNQRATSPAARWPSQLPCPGPALPPSAESGKSALAAAQGCTITWAPTGRSS